MLSQTGERTLIAAIAPPKSSCINTVTSIVFSQNEDLLLAEALLSSVPYDALIKILGRSDFYYETAQSLPWVKNKYATDLIARSLLLNAVTEEYSSLYESTVDSISSANQWAKNDTRLSNSKFISLPSSYRQENALRTDYERREAMIEIDVLTAMALNMSLNQLNTLYRILFPVLQSYEADTWYDTNGRIVFTNNRSLTGVGFSRPEFENPNVVTPIHRSDAPWDGIMKHAPAGYVFARTITDDTMPGGPIERTIEYHAPFDRCNREQDYETAWKFFEEKYGKER